MRAGVNLCAVIVDSRYFFLHDIFPHWFNGAGEGGWGGYVTIGGDSPALRSVKGVGVSSFPENNVT